MTADYEQAVVPASLRSPLCRGTLAALIETIREADHLLVENVAVSPSFQGRGLGRRLMAHAEVLARELGFGEIRLYTNQRFAENIALYRKLGYQVDREEVLPVGIVIHMSKHSLALGPGAAIGADDDGDQKGGRPAEHHHAGGRFEGADHAMLRRQGKLGRAQRREARQREVDRRRRSS